MSDSRSGGVRWGLVLVMVLVGTVGMWRVVGWYFDPARPQGSLSAETASFTPPPAITPKGAPPPPPATEAELALLESVDAGNQIKGAEALLARAVTPELVTAVDAALARRPVPEVEARLVCVKSRFEGAETLEFLLSRFPKERKALAWNLMPDVECVLRALAARINDAPDRIVTALMPAIYASSLATRETALNAFRTTDMTEIPTLLVAEASTVGSPDQSMALAAAVALGAIRLNPGMVASALRNRDTRQRVSYELKITPHANGPRILANVSSERPLETDLQGLVREREGQMHDVSAALLEIVANVSENEGKRTAAARQLIALQETGALRDLRALSPSLEPGQLKGAVDEAIRVLEERQRIGARPQMRALPL